jgi:hypothetical protein
MASATFRDWWLWLLALLGVVAACVWFGPAAEHFFLGWIYFPMRVLPQVTVDIPAVLIGCISLAGFIFGVHFTVRWWLRATAATNDVRSWSWRSSFALSTLTLLLFVAGTAMVGATHQLVWLIQGRASTSPNSVEPVQGIVEAAREAARRESFKYELGQLGFGAANFQDCYLSLPPGGTKRADGELMHGWASYLMPFTSSTADLDFSVPWNKPPNARYFQCNLPLFVNPSIPGPYFDPDGFGYAHIAGNIRVLPIVQIELEPGQGNIDSIAAFKQLKDRGEVLTQSKITDGASNTILFGTVARNFKPWGHPANVRDPATGIGKSPDGFAGPPIWDGAMFVMCDGSVRFMSDKTDPRVMRQLATPAGGDAN